MSSRLPLTSPFSPGGLLPSPSSYAGEPVLAVQRQSFRRSEQVMVGFFIIFYFLWFFHLLEHASRTERAMTFWGLPLWGYLGVKAGLDYLHTMAIVTDQRVVKRTGAFRVTTESVPMDEIDYVRASGPGELIVGSTPGGAALQFDDLAWEQPILRAIEAQRPDVEIRY